MQFEVNVIGLQDLTNRFIPVFCRQGWGRIVNVSSVAGRLPLPLIGAYCASKHALEAMSDCLRIELRGSGVAVSIIEPGVVDTGIFDKASHAMLQLLSAAAESRFAAFYRRAADPGYRAKPRRRLMTRPDVVAGVIRHALESARPRRRYPVTAPARILPVLRRIAPDALLDRLMYARLRKAGEP
jgi:short-subunit dehydrogenase